jgi:hypothetical protein
MTLFEAQTDAGLLLEAARKLEEYLRQPNLEAALGRAKMVRVYTADILKFLETA